MTTIQGLLLKKRMSVANCELVMNKIVEYCPEAVESLRDFIHPSVYHQWSKKHVLMYGYIQSGKTKAILDTIKSFDKNVVKIMVIQNSVLCLKQYEERMKLANLPYYSIPSIPENRKKLPKIPYDPIPNDKNKNPIFPILLIMNNVYRKKAFRNLFPDLKNYILFLDEADQTWRACQSDLVKHAIKIYYITATPFILSITPGKKTKENRWKDFDEIIKLPVPKDYYGIFPTTKIHNQLEPEEPAELAEEKETAATETESSLIMEISPTSDFEYIQNFLHGQQQQGMLLITKYNTISAMHFCAKEMSSMFQDTPIIVMSTDFQEYTAGKAKLLKQQSVSKLIDQYQHEYPRIILIANRVAMRGISFVSTDYKRHLTHQWGKVKPSLTNLLQSSRICGIYPKPNGIPKLSFSYDEKHSNNKQLVKKMQEFNKFLELISYHGAP
jgi:hypothetical protein